MLSSYSFEIIKWNSVKSISISKSSKQYKHPTVLIVDKTKHLLLHTLFSPGNQNDVWGYKMNFEIKNLPEVADF